MKIAIEGCCHGELEKIYGTLEHLQHESGIKVDLLIICGDFQAARNEKDLESMAIKEKYRDMCSFWKYYAGVKQAPVLTLFVGGNHEASNFLSELPYGGWVAPNIYYMGYANVITFGGIRIAGLSGIYKSQDYYKGHFEIPPYNFSNVHSAYHVRNLEVFRLSQVKAPIDIMITHDWPRGVYNQADCDQLLRFKPFLADELNSNTLGSPENERLLKTLQPAYWFSAHLHCKFACLYKHEQGKDTQVPPKCTQFLALDKCLPGRRFLQVIDIEARNDKRELCLDPEWLCVLKQTDKLLSIATYNQAPISEKENFTVSQESIDELTSIMQDFTIPPNFNITASIYDPKNPTNDSRDIYINEQTTLLCEILEIRDPINLLLEKQGRGSVVNESRSELYNSHLNDNNEIEDDDAVE